MSNSLTSFDFNGNPIRALLTEGQPWLVAADVCRVLGHTNTTVAMEMVEPEDRRSFSRSEALNFSEVFPDRRVQSANMINESGLYALIFSSNLAAAKQFKRWVTSEVLPAIRRAGGYIRPDATPDQLAGIIARAEGQMRILKLAEGLVDTRWLETKTRHVIARSLGEEPEVAPEDRPLTTGEFLEEKGLSGAALRSTSPTFGKAVKAEYVITHGREPGKADRFVEGTTRSVFAYTEAERPLFERAWSRMRPTIV